MYDFQILSDFNRSHRNDHWAIQWNYKVVGCKLQTQLIILMFNDSTNQYQNKCYRLPRLVRCYLFTVGLARSPYWSQPFFFSHSNRLNVDSEFFFLSGITFESIVQNLDINILTMSHSTQRVHKINLFVMDDLLEQHLIKMRWTVNLMPWNVLNRKFGF